MVVAPNASGVRAWENKHTIHSPNPAQYVPERRDHLSVRPSILSQTSMTRGSKTPFQDQHQRTVIKRSHFEQHRSNNTNSNKRVCKPSIAKSSMVTLKDYFNKLQANTPASSDLTLPASTSTTAAVTIEADDAGFARNIERAIALSLEQEIDTDSSEAKGQSTNNTGEVDETTTPTAATATGITATVERPPHNIVSSIKIHEETKDKTLASGEDEGEEEDNLTDQVKNVHIETAELAATAAYQPLPKACPICEKDIGTGDLEKMNLHINRCLDIGTASSQQHGEARRSSSSTSLGSSVKGVCDVLSPKVCNTATSLTSTANPVEKKPYRAKNKKERNPRKPCPYHKWIQDTEYTVDAFSYGNIPGCQGYFLSHFHSDHYKGLSKLWSHGPIYCSKVTANLVKQELGVAPEYICPLSLNKRHTVSETVTVTLIDANHCPGSVLFLFEVMAKEGSSGCRVIRHLHTGDFRASPRMCLHPAVREGPIDFLYLDTTYLDEHYKFPGQEEVVDAACNVAEAICNNGSSGTKEKAGGLLQWLKSSPSAAANTAVLTDEIEGTLASFNKEKRGLPNNQPRVLIVVGTYKIGKEKVFFHLAKRLKYKVFVNETKRRILECQENSELSSLLTDDPYEAQIHVVGMLDLKVVALESYLKEFGSHFSSVLAFRPTGWVYGGGGGYNTKRTTSTSALSAIIEPPADRTVRLLPDKASTSAIKIYGIPYSEHSSFRELAVFISSLDIVSIIPTVNMTKAENRERQFEVLNRWQYEKKVSGIKSVPYPSEDYW